MSLFPAYGLDAPLGGEVESTEPAVRWEAVAESELLASSDSDAGEASSPDKQRRGAAGEAAVAPREGDYYEDRRLDCGNLRVSTIYYPGRPQYTSEDYSRAIGLCGKPRASRKRPRRYWERASGGEDAGGGDGAGAGEGERAALLRAALRERPHDELLWLQYVDYQEWAGGAAAGAAAAGEGSARLPRARALRARRLDALRRALPPHDYLERLRDELAQEKEAVVRGALWARLVAALGRGAAGDGPRAARDAAAAATRDLRRLPQAYPQLVFQYGLVLRAGGLWEMLVLLVELLLAMHCAAPAPPDAGAALRAERALLDQEDKMIASGLPSVTVWARVERARGAAHWRPAVAVVGGEEGGDPQRAPAPADLADLLAPVADPDALRLLAATLLRLAKVPLLPATGYVCTAAGAPEPGDGGEALLPLLRAARRLPRPPPAAAARRLLQRAADPPHYFADEYGFRSWVESLWDAVLDWTGGATGPESAGAAILCWRLRWLHSLLLLVVDDPAYAAEVKRIRESGQAALRRWGGSHCVAFALWARLAPPPAARRAAAVALRAALTAPRPQLLYAARIFHEVHSESSGGGMSAPGAWALASAVLRRAPPQDVSAPPPAQVMEEALAECERRCIELEAEMEAEQDQEECRSHESGGGGALAAAMLPSEAEWAVARALLAPPARKAQLLREILESHAGRGRLARWREQAAAVLARLAPAAAPARLLAPRYPHNALLALMASDASLRCAGGAAPGAPLLGGVRARAAALPALLRAAQADWEPDEAGVAARVLRRVAGDDAVLCGLRLEAEARAPRPRLAAAAAAALDALQDHKWVVVRCGALGAGGAELADVLLERGLRLHALPDELRPLALDR